MLQHLRNRARGQEGFTLIELLVVILIIGILAAVAIPTFLSQTQKAQDSNVTAYLNSAQTADATYQTSNGAYAPNAAALQAIEKTLNSAPSLNTTVAGAGAAALAVPGTNPAVSITNGFEVDDTSTTTGVKYSLYYNADDGSVYKTCSAANKGVCNASSQW